MEGRGRGRWKAGGNKQHGGAGSCTAWDRPRCSQRRRRCYGKRSCQAGGDALMSCAACCVSLLSSPRQQWTRGKEREDRWTVQQPLLRSQLLSLRLSVFTLSHLRPPHPTCRRSLRETLAQWWSVECRRWIYSARARADRDPLATSFSCPASPSRTSPSTQSRHLHCSAALSWQPCTCVGHVAAVRQQPLLAPPPPRRTSTAVPG